MVKTTVGWRGSLYSRPFTTRKPSTRWIVQDDGVQYVAVAAGAMLGANLRYLVGNWAADRWGADFPYGTFLINLTGAFAIGVLLAFIGERVGVSPLWRLFFATGFLGGYTPLNLFTSVALTVAPERESERGRGIILGSKQLRFVRA